MLYELRIYDTMPNRLPALNERFRSITLDYFAKHDIEPVAFWTEVVGTSNRLTYLLRWRDMAHREGAWTAFMTDPDRLADFAVTEIDGPILKRARNILLSPTGYSPMQ